MNILKNIFALFKKRVRIGVYLFTAFIGVVLITEYTTYLDWLDLLSFKLALMWRTETLVYIMRFFTLLGNSETIAVLAVIAVFVLFLRRHWDAFVVLITALGSAIALTWIAKVLIGRLRPEEIFALVPATGFSMPSGHALIGLVFYGLLTYLLYTRIKDTSKQTVVVIGASALIFLIGISRVYLSVHWFTDVVAGWLAGGALLIFFIGLLEFLRPTSSS